jgi:Rrf2 family nitric oxide-sensitive transcriptional repressor
VEEIAMRLTRFTDYSLRVLIYLGQNSENRVTIYQIAEAYGISKNHLMKVVSNLSRLQFVTAQRGPGGGIRLNRLPEDIRLNDVIGCTEKHLQELGADSQSGDIEATVHSRLGNFLRHAMQAYLDDLAQFSLADVLEPESDANQMLELNDKAA